MSHMLSIQQRDLLALEAGHRWPSAQNISVVYPAPEDLSMGALREFLSRVMQVDGALRTCRVSLDEDRAWLAENPEPPLHELSTSSGYRTRDFLKQERHRSFPRDQGPLWRVTVLDTSEEARISPGSRLLVCTFDHLISDWVSSELFKNGLSTLQWRHAAPGSDYLSWTQWQRAQLASNSTSLQFWERYLSTEVLDAYRISLPSPSAPLSGRVRRSWRSVPTPASALRRACRENDTVAFAFVVAAAMRGLVSSGLKDDLIAVVMCTARTPRFRRVLGYLAAWVPLKLDLSRCHDVRSALALADESWAQVQPHQYVPAYGYMDSAGLAHDTFAGRLNINYVPFPTPFPVPDAMAEGTETGVNLLVRQTVNGSHVFICSFDPKRIDARFIDDFLDGMAEAWRALLGEQP